MSNCFYCGNSEHVTADCRDKGQSTKSCTPGRLVPGSSDESAAEFLSRIDEMMESGEFDWAEDTLSGIKESVEKWEKVSEGQMRAVRNIAEARGWSL